MSKHCVESCTLSKEMGVTSLVDKEGAELATLALNKHRNRTNGRIIFLSQLMALLITSFVDPQVWPRAMLHSLQVV